MFFFPPLGQNAMAAVTIPPRIITAATAPMMIGKGERFGLALRFRLERARFTDERAGLESAGGETSADDERSVPARLAAGAVMVSFAGGVVSVFDWGAAGSVERTDVVAAAAFWEKALNHSPRAAANCAIVA